MEGERGIEEMGNYCLMDTVSVQGDEKVLGWMIVMVTQQYECTEYHKTVHLKMVKIITFHVIYILPE